MSRKHLTLYAQVAGDKLYLSRNLSPPDVVPYWDWRPPTSASVDRIAMRGGPENAHMIASLSWASSRQLPVPPVYLCTSQIHGPDVAAVFAAMRSLNLAGSLGGYHQLSERDGPSYALAAAVQAADGRVSTEASGLLREHRAWPALSFVSRLDEVSAVQLLCEILDPRWFVSAKNPNSLSRLYGFCGLSPLHMANALAGRPPSCKQSRRCAAVLSAWYRGPQARYNELDPGSFLLRVVESYPVEHKIKGFVRASKMFLAFVRNVWLDMMAPPGRRLFVPKYFFSQETVAQAFQQHWAEFSCWRTV